MELWWDILVFSCGILIVVLGLRRVLRYYNEIAIEELTEFAIEADKKAEARRKYIATVYAAAHKTYEYSVRYDRNPYDNVQANLLQLRTIDELKRFVAYAEEKGNEGLTALILEFARQKIPELRACHSE